MLRFAPQWQSDSDLNERFESDFLPYGMFFYILTCAYSEEFYIFATAVKTYNTCISIY